VFQKLAELDRLVRFVVVHRAVIETDGAQSDRGRQRECDKHAGADAAHFAEP
jgi:hypothetical protein